MSTDYPVESLWSVIFGAEEAPSVESIGGGVLILETGRVMGGDSGFYYTGDYTVSGNSITATIRVRRHNNLMESVFGDLDDFTMDAVGEFSEKGRVFSFEAHVPGSPQTMHAHCTWLAPLP